MQNTFNDLEALDIAIKIEERGERFYRMALPFAENKEIKDMLVELAEDEKDHADTFRGLYSEIAKSKENLDDKYLYEAEVSAYLRSIADNSIFPSNEAQDAIFKTIKDTKDVLKIGIQVEKDSIMFYTEMIIKAKYEGAKNAFRRLAKEEKAHLLNLQVKYSEIVQKRISDTQ